MAINRGLYVRQHGGAPNAVGTTPQEARLALAGLVAENAPGVPRQGLMHQAKANVVTGTASMSYDASAVTPVIVRSANDGVYMPTLSGITNVPTIAAPASGSRIDLIWVKQNDPEKGDPDNTAVFGVTQGTSDAIPVRPDSSVPVGAYVIASKIVAAGQTNTLTGAPIVQEWVHTVTRGANIPVKSAADQATITPGPGVSIRRLDLPGNPVFASNGTAWNGGTWVNIPNVQYWERQSADPAQYLISNGQVSYQGKFHYIGADTTAGSNSGTALLMGTVPVEARPAKAQARTCLAVWGATNVPTPCRVEIQPDGRVLMFGLGVNGQFTPFSVTKNTYVFMSAFAYPLAV